MQRIKNEYGEMTIEYGQIDDFFNTCKVLKMKEKFNITIKYKPDKWLLEIQSYREFFKNNEFNMYVEELCSVIFEKLNHLLEPKELEVIIHVTDDRLTPWKVVKTKE